MTNKILLGFEVGSGASVQIPLHHLVITGMTQLAGKTTTIEALIYRSGLRAIVFKTKRGEKGFEAAGKNLPMYYEERGDWQYVSSLMEATLREKLKFERSWIIRITKDKYRTDHPLKEVYDRLTELLKSKKLRGIDESIYTNLQAYLDIVLPKLAKLSTTNRIIIEQGVNVMDLEGIAESPEIQALIIRSVMEHILESESNVIVVVPECWKFLPQGKSTPVKVFFESFIRQGAAIGNFLWLDTQDLGGVDKTELRSVNDWILGRQRESNEVQRTLDQIPLPKNKKPTELDIMNLKIGHFYAACGDEVKLVYVLPAGISEEMGIRVAKGQATVEEASRQLDQLRSRNHGKEDNADLVWKEKYEELERKFQEALLKRDTESAELLKKNTELTERLLETRSQQELRDKRITDLGKQLTEFENLRKALSALLPSVAIAPIASTNGKLRTLTIQGEELTVSVKKPVEEILEFNTEKAGGKIMYMIIVENGNKPMTQIQLVDMAREHGWVLSQQIISMEANKLVAKGILVSEGSPVTYRLPARLKVKVEK